MFGVCNSILILIYLSVNYNLLKFCNLSCTVLGSYSTNTAGLLSIGLFGNTSSAATCSVISFESSELIYGVSDIDTVSSGLVCGESDSTSIKYDNIFI